MYSYLKNDQVQLPAIFPNIYENQNPWHIHIFNIHTNIRKNKMCYETQMIPERQIPEVAIIVKIQGQDFKIYGSNIKVLSQVTCI
jgi:hypothetical protein